MLPVLLTLASLAAAAPGEGPLFRAAPADALAGVTTTCGSAAKDWILEVNGGGLVVEDFDGDGSLDLVVVDGSTVERARAGEPGLPPRLLLGDGRGAFRPAGPEWGLAGGRWGMGGCAGDVDGDGRPDLLITEWGRDRLFLNRGGEGFEEVTERSGLAGEEWSTSACFADFDGDGTLDLFVVSYLAFDLEHVAPRGSGCTWKGHEVMCGPEGLAPQRDRFYRGLGDGRFVDASERAGLHAVPPAFGLGATTLDLDQDGDVDVYVANDSTPNHLWENQGDGTFREVGYRRGVGHDANGREQAGMGIACGDVDGDGKGDLFVTNFSGESNALYLSTAGRGFRERAAALGLGGPSVRRLGWGTGLHDLDLDGRLDLFVLNGHVYPEADRPGTDTSYAQADQLFRGSPDGRFAEEPLDGLPPAVTRAGLAFDADGDGDLDLARIELGGAVRLLINEAPHDGAHRWLRVRLRGAGANTAAVGARVTAEWEGGRRAAEVRTSAGFQAGCPAEVHFGLGPVERLEALVVRWPSGRERRLEDVAVDRVLTVREEAE